MILTRPHTEPHGTGIAPIVDGDAHAAGHIGPAQLEQLCALAVPIIAGALGRLRYRHMVGLDGPQLVTHTGSWPTNGCQVGDQKLDRPAILTVDG